MKIISFGLKLQAVRPNYVTTMYKWMFAQNRVVVILQYTISFQNLFLNIIIPVWHIFKQCKSMHTFNPMDCSFNAHMHS